MQDLNYLAMVEPANAWHRIAVVQWEIWAIRHSLAICVPECRHSTACRTARADDQQACEDRWTAFYRAFIVRLLGKDYVTPVEVLELMEAAALQDFSGVCLNLSVQNLKDKRLIEKMEAKVLLGALKRIVPSYRAEQEEESESEMDLDTNPAA